MSLLTRILEKTKSMAKLPCYSFRNLISGKRNEGARSKKKKEDKYKKRH